MKAKYKIFNGVRFRRYTTFYGKDRAKEMAERHRKLYGAKARVVKEPKGWAVYYWHKGV